MIGGEDAQQTVPESGGASGSSGSGTPIVFSCPQQHIARSATVSGAVVDVGADVMTLVSIGGQPASASSCHGYGQHSNSLLPDSELYDESPVRFRNLNEIYEMTEEIELDSDVEALLAVMEEPTCYKDAAGDENWEAAMRSELQSTSKNRT